MANFLPDERGDGLEIEAFVLPAGDEHERLGRAQQRLLERVEIRRLRVVDVIDTADRADEFEPVELRAIRSERRHHFRKGEAAGATDSKRGHHVLGVVRTGQVRLRKVQHRRSLIFNPAVA